VLLALRAGETCCVCDLAWIVGRDEKLVSHHVRLLKSLGVVSSRRDGRMVMYELTDAGAALVDAFDSIRAVAARAHDAEALEQAHMMRDQLLVTPDDPRQIANATRLAGAQREQHGQARRICQRLHPRRGCLEHLGGRKAVTQRLGLRKVEAQQLAGVALIAHAPIV
jgi:DNA-binding transcriptional ArsR family regulator